MKVKKLIEILQDYNPDDLVILSIDEEGNAFNELRFIGEMRYSRDWKEAKYRTLTPEMKERGYCEDDIYTEEQGVNCIVLWP